MNSDNRTAGFWLLAAFFAAFVLFLYGPMLVIVVLSFQGPEGGLTFPLPLAAAAHQLFLAAAAAGHGAKDDAFVIRVWEALAGIALPEAKKD